MDLNLYTIETAYIDYLRNYEKLYNVFKKSLHMVRNQSILMRW